MTIDIQYANEHLIELCESEISEIKKLREITSYDELRKMKHNDKQIMANLIYSIVHCVYCSKSGGYVPESKIKVIAKNDESPIWCMCIKERISPPTDQTEYKIFDCSSPIWDREVNQW